jgi:hypothetical protein
MTETLPPVGSSVSGLGLWQSVLCDIPTKGLSTHAGSEDLPAGRIFSIASSTAVLYT